MKRSREVLCRQGDAPAKNPKNGHAQNGKHRPRNLATILLRLGKGALQS
jgi:hypothetical protein